MKARALILFVCISLAAVAALAHGGEEHVIGTVSKVTSDSITVKTTDNKMVTVGVVPATMFMMGNLTLGSLVGFVTLFGITLRNSIMLISHYEHLVGVEGQAWGLDTMLRGASERLGPILMTALVTGLGLLPLAIGSGDPGREIEGPMAIVILGGLVTSTLLNLLVLPTLALRYSKFEVSGQE